MTRPADATWLRPLGSTGITVSALTLGGGPLGSMPALFGDTVPTERAIELVHRAFESPVRTIDTSNGYSDGESERRIGAAIAAAGGLPDGVNIITKVDPRDGDFSGDRVRESVLADPTIDRYAYRPANEGVRRAVDAMVEVCAAFDTTLAVAALQFSLRDPGIATSIVGMSSPERLDQTLRAAEESLPDELFTELERHVPEPQWWLEPTS